MKTPFELWDGAQRISILFSSSPLILTFHFQFYKPVFHRVVRYENKMKQNLSLLNTIAIY